MQFDESLLLRILESLEHRSSFVSETPRIEGYTRAQIQHHCWLALKDGLITGVDDSDFDCAFPCAVPIGLTLKGREWLEEWRNDHPKEKARRLIAETGKKFVIVLLARVLLTVLLALLAWMGYDLLK